MTESLLDSLLRYWYMWTIGVLLAGIAVGFLMKFVVPALKIGMVLSAALTALGRIRDRCRDTVVDLDSIAGDAMLGSRLSHLWNEYAETLHPQKEFDALGQARIVRWRATALAESFFTEQALVDTPLKTEFYKHLPGILTGLGIIGTFTGLIIGLINFDVSLDPNQAQAQLRNLINAVGHAFFVSAAAITLAMLFTWIEKSLVTARYRQVEDLRQLVDGLFGTGAGEEYLERLVTASETSATQAVHLKDALVEQFREVLTELAARQIEASARQSKEMSADVGKVITERLGGPISAIASAVRGMGAGQGEAVNNMVSEVLANFSAQLQHMFGGQMHGVNDMLQQSTVAMRATAAQFGQLTASMDAAGKGALETISERLGHAFSAMESRQQIMNQQMGEFVLQIRSLVAESQTQSSRNLQETLTKLGDQVVSVVGQLQEQARAASASQEEQTERISRQAGVAVSGLSGQVEALVAQSTEASRSLQATVEGLAKVTNDAVAGMSAGADTLYLAATSFAKAGQGVSETMNASAAGLENIKSASQTLALAAGATQEMLGDYAKTRDTFAVMVSELKATIENAKREAAMTSDLVDGLQAASGQLSTAQRKSEEYLKSVSEVLVKAHQSFAENVERTLRESNRQFQKELSEAVSLLSGAIKDLGDTLDDLPAKR